MDKLQRMHHRINERAFMQTRYNHPKIGQIVNNVLFKRKDETNLLIWKNSHYPN